MDIAPTPGVIIHGVTCIDHIMYLVFRGQYETNVNYMFETNLYDIRGKQLVYSVQTKSEDPSNVYVLADDYSRSIINDIKKKNIFGS